MAISGRTPHANLPQWMGTDKPEMQDFNEAFANIDTELANKANIGSPQIYDIEYVGPFENFKGMDSYYLKTQENLVVLELSAQKSSLLKNDDVISILPEGFRPDKWRERACVLNSPLSGAAMVGVHPDGTIRVRVNENQITYQTQVFFSIVFPTAQ